MGSLLRCVGAAAEVGRDEVDARVGTRSLERGGGGDRGGGGGGRTHQTDRQTGRQNL